jgi:hypothetical protein
MSFGIEHPNLSRISLDPSDPSYRRDHGDFVVLLDGSPVPFAITADAIAGEVLCTEVDDEGRPIADGDLWVWRRKCGRVEIRPALVPA